MGPDESGVGTRRNRTMPEPTHYGDEAQTNKRYTDLTDKQQAVVDEYISRDGNNRNNKDVAHEAGCTPSYVSYVRNNFPHILEERDSTMRTVAADGEGHYDVTIGTTDAFKMIKLLPEELSKKIYDQVRSQDARPDGGLFDDDE